MQSCHSVLSPAGRAETQAGSGGLTCPPQRLVKFALIKRFWRSGTVASTGHLRVPTSPAALVDWRNVQIGGDGVARIVRLVLALGQHDRGVRNLLIRHVL